MNLRRKIFPIKTRKKIDVSPSNAASSVDRMVKIIETGIAQEPSKASKSVQGRKIGKVRMKKMVQRSRDRGRHHFFDARRQRGPGP